MRYPNIDRTAMRTIYPRSIVSALISRDGTLCPLCGIELCEPIEIDHVIPWSAGGPDTTNNLRATHALCNQWRSNHVHEDDERPRLQVAAMCWTCQPDMTHASRVLAYCTTCEAEHWTTPVSHHPLTRKDSA